MNPFTQKKVLIFGMLGVLGCLAGWAAGEGLLAAGLPKRESKTGHAPSLATRPEAPPSIEPAGKLTSPTPNAPVLSKRDPTLPQVAPPYPPSPTLEKRNPPPPLPPEYEARAKKAGAKSGQLQFTLIWSNRNDLDLHCIDPFGVEIFYQHKKSAKSGGHLDVDRNVTGETTEPVENIYFPDGKAPLGRYRVFVRHYRNHGDRDPTEYKANLLIEDRRLEFSGKITFDESQPRQAIHEFHLTGLRMAVPSEITLYPGGRNKFRVKLERERNNEAVRLTFAGEMAGLKLPDSVFIPHDRDDAEIDVAAEPGATLGPRNLRLIAESKYGKVEAKTRIAVQETPPSLQLGVPAEVALFAGGKNTLRVRLERDRPDEPVRLTFAGDTNGLKLPGEVSVPANTNETAFEVTADPKAAGGTRRVRIIGDWKHGTAEAVCSFNVKIPPAVLHLAAPREVAVFTGNSNRMMVRIAREHFAGPVRVRATEGDGVALSEVVISANREEGEIEITAASYAKEGARPVTLIATGTGTQATTRLSVNVGLTPPPPAAESTWSWRLVLVIGLWTALLAIGLSLALVIGQNRYLARPWLSLREAAILIAGGGLAGLVAGGIGQALFALLSGSSILPQIGFLAGWLLLGGLLGRGVGFFIPNLHAWRAALAGMIGGLFGALAFILVSKMGNVPGRFVGSAILGCCIGLMVALVEAAFRKAWLEVRYGSREVIAVNLGPEPIRIGGDGKACTIWARGAEPVAFRIWVKAGQVVCEDVARGRIEELIDGASRQAGNVELIVHTGVKEAAVIANRADQPPKETPIPAPRVLSGPVPPPPPPGAKAATKSPVAREKLPPPPPPRRSV